MFFPDIGVKGIEQNPTLGSPLRRRVPRRLRRVQKERFEAFSGSMARGHAVRGQCIARDWKPRRRVSIHPSCDAVRLSNRAIHRAGQNTHLHP